MASRSPPASPLLSSASQKRAQYPSSSSSFAFAPTSPQRPLRGGCHQLQHGGAAARVSPRQVKLQRVEPPAYALRLTLRDHVAANFHHELFQFHQTLRDAAAKCEQVEASLGHKVPHHHHQQQQPRALGASGARPAAAPDGAASTSSPLARFDRSVLELLTSDRGDAILKEFFHQWQHRTSATSTSVNSDGDELQQQQHGTHDVLWDVFETFFKSVPLVLPDNEVNNAKSYFRYLDALRSLRDVLLALLYKRPSGDQYGCGNGIDDDDDAILGCSGSSLGLLLSNASSLSAATHAHGHQSSPSPSRTRLQPMHEYCRQLEQELRKLRERHPNRSRIAGFRASLKRSERQDVGLLNDATVLLLLDFWELPRTERLGFFCQIASQTHDEDAAMALRVFLDNCSTRNFLEVWDVLQQSPLFESTFSAAARQHCAALQHDVSETGALSGKDGSPGTAETGDGADSDSKSKRRSSARHRERRASRSARKSLSLRSSNGQQRYRQSRFIDLGGLTEAFDERDDGDELDVDSNSDSDRDSDDGVNGSGTKRRFQKILIRERGRTPPDERHGSLNRAHRRHRHQQSHRYEEEKSAQLLPVSPAAKEYQLPPVNPHASLMQRLHDDLVEVIKQDELSTGNSFSSTSDHLASPVVMDSIWKLLELLDTGKKTGGSFQRHAPGATSRQSSVSGFGSIERGGGSTPFDPSRAGSIRQDLTSAPPRQTLLLDANLTRDQQFMIKFDQLQSLLTGLGAFSLHEMATETISSVYRRMPTIARLFSSVHGKTCEAAGVVAPTRVVAGNNSSGAGLDFALAPQVYHHRASSATVGGLSLTRQQRSVSIVPASAVPLGSADDQVIEAAGMLMAKVGKMVRSLVNLDQLSSGGDKSPSLDVLALLKLADDMEEGASLEPAGAHADESALVSGKASSETYNNNSGRRVSMLDHSRRLAILHKLKTLALSNEIDEVAAMVSDTVKDAHEQHVQQIEQIEKLSSSSAATGKPQRRHRGRSRLETLLDAEDGGNGGSDEDDSADEVLKMAKKAKTRRASAVKAQQSHGTAPDPAGSGDDDEGDDDESSRARTGLGRRDVLLNFRQVSGPQKSTKLFSVSILLRIVYQIYRENFEGMVSSLQYGSRRMEFSEFLYDWHIRKYGLKTLAQQHLLKLIQSLRKYEKKTFQCQLCLRFLGIQSPLGYHEHKFVLGLLDKWSLGTFAGATKHRVEHTPRQFKLRLTFAIATLQDALNERFGVYFRSMDTVAGRIRTHAMTTPGDEDFVKETDVLRIAIDEYVLQRERLEQILEAVYVAGDLNGDGGLEYDEFAAVVSHLSPVADDKVLQKIFAAAYDVVKLPRRISFARFLDVILLERILSSTASSAARSSGGSGNGGNGNSSTAASKSAILGDDSSSSRGAVSTRVGAGAGTAGSSSLASLEDEEAYQFNLLQQTWEHDRDAVASALKLITHQQTAASLTFRVAFLTQILLKRVDSKTAWMCHRQIMRDISRYQNLNEEQIVELKTKEETFRKAVLAVTHLRKLGALLGSTSNDKVLSDGAADADADTDAGVTATAGTASGRQGDAASDDESLDALAEHRYTIAVEQTLEGFAQQPSTQDMAALEDELRERFLAQADATAIEDFKSALQQLRRMSLCGGDLALELSPEQLATLMVTTTTTPAHSERFDEVDEDDNDGGDEDEDGDEDEIGSEVGMPKMP